jgi:hypothetical protein
MMMAVADFYLNVVVLDDVISSYHSYPWYDEEASFYTCDGMKVNY